MKTELKFPSPEQNRGKKSLYKLTSLSLLSLILFVNCYASPARVEDISGRKYFPAVKEAIDNAQSSIHMAMYVLRFRTDASSPVYELVKSLVKAKERGVEVKVILDKNINFFTGELEDKNKESYKYLKDKGIEVFYDDIYTYTHSKALVIDEEIVIAGSANWSNTALTQSNEISVLNRSAKLAKSVLEGFGAIKLYEEKLSGLVNLKDGLAVSNEFLIRDDLAGRMITKQDQRAFDLYLLLLYNAKEKSTVDFDFDRYAKDLGIYEDMSRTAYRRQIIKTLKKLEKRYKLIEAEFNFAANADVKLLDIKFKDKNYSYPSENYFLISPEYFKYNWDRKLSFAAKYNYLINRYMVQESNSRYWSVSQKNIAEKFNLSVETINRGMQELRRLNIIVIVYSPTNEEHVHIRPSLYELRGLYSPREHVKQLKELEKKYGKEKVKNAVEFTRVVYRQNDIDAIEEIIKMTEEYGEERVNKAYRILSKKAVDNPKRTYRYAVGVIKSLSEVEVGDLP